MVTLTDVIAYLKDLPDGAIAGVTSSGGACPVANYMRWRTGSEKVSTVSMDSILLDMQNKLIIHDEDVVTFITTIDSLSDHEVEITKEQALAIAEGIVHER